MDALKIIFGLLIQLDVILLISLLIYVVFFKHQFKKSAVAIGGILMFILVLPLPRILFHSFEHALPNPMVFPADAKGLILLGGYYTLGTHDMTERPQYNMAAGRLVEFISLAHKHPTLPIVFTGTPYEAKWTKEIFNEAGINPKRVTIEDASHSTHDNAVKSFAVVKPKAMDRWVLVTSAFHMPRSILCFQKAGWNVVPYSVDYHTPKHLTAGALLIGLIDRLNPMVWRTMVVEIAGLVNYRLEGKTDRFWINK
jgi:uncharacterized SAM-binding protein YcdF (DUF218 family)